MEFIITYRFIITISFFILLFLLEMFIPFYTYQENHWKHGLRNIGMGAINSSIDLGLMLLFMPALMMWCETRCFGLLNHIVIPYGASIVIVFLVMDLWMYLWHRLLHTSILWRLHRVHHSDKSMDSTTIYRFHTLEIIISFVLKSIIMVLLGVDVLQIGIYVLAMNIVTYFHHSNVTIPHKLDRILRWVFVSQNHHRVHHSVKPGEFHSNYGAVFSFWDRIFASFVKGEQFESIKIGLNILRDDKWQTIGGMLFTPFKEVRTTFRNQKNKKSDTNDDLL